MFYSHHSTEGSAIGVSDVTHPFHTSVPIRRLPCKDRCTCIRRAQPAVHEPYMVHMTLRDVKKLPECSETSAYNIQTPGNRPTRRT